MSLSHSPKNITINFAKTFSMDTFLTFNSGKIFYKDNGNGPVIALVHGYLETSEIWAGFATRLSENFRVITVDLPGHGKSDSFGDIHTMEFMAGMLSKLFENLETGKLFLVGHSLGGYVTLAFADLYPEMLSGYCLFHSQPFADTPETVEKREKEIGLAREGRKDLFCQANVTRMFSSANLGKFSPELMKSRDIASAIPGEAIIAVLKGMINRPSRIKVLESGIVPCLWVLGAQDNYISCEAVRAKVHLPGNAQVMVLNNSGHMGFIEEEERSLRVITDFVNGVVYHQNQNDRY